MLNHQTLKKWPGVDQSCDLFESIDNIVGWKATPPFAETGRSAQVIPDEPMAVDTPNGTVYIERIKIKGVGLCDFEGNISKPSSVHFKMYSPHVGISSKGEFSILTPGTKPMGGLVLEKATMEYHVADVLFEHGIPTEIPMRLYEYTDPEMFFEESSGNRSKLGVVVAGQHSLGYDRADIMLKYSEADDDAVQRMNQFAEAVGIDISDDPELSLLSFVYESYGHYIRKFSQAQLYRHSGHCSNIGFSLHTKSIYFTDIDSCRTLSECGEINTGLQVMRDCLSGAYHIFGILTEPVHAEKFSSQRVINSGIFRRYLKHYHHDLPESLVDNLGQILEEHYAEVHASVIKSIAQKKQEQKEEQEEGGEVDYQAAYDAKWHRTTTVYQDTHSWFLSVCWTLHKHGSISKEFPFKIPEAEFYDNIANLSSPELVETIRARIAKAIEAA